jgi:hypothetical protein
MMMKCIQKTSGLIQFAEMFVIAVSCTCYTVTLCQLDMRVGVHCYWQHVYCLLK